MCMNFKRTSNISQYNKSNRALKEKDYNYSQMIDNV